MPDFSQESANMMKDRTLPWRCKQTGRRWIQLVSEHYTKRRERVEGDSWNGKDTLKNFGLFHELSVGIKGLMKCLLDTRSSSNRQWSKADSGKSAHWWGGSISWLGGVLTLII